MTDLRKAAEMALDALEWSWGGEPLGTKEFEAITALRAALAQPEQEPLSLRLDIGGGFAAAVARCGSQVEFVSQELPSKPERSGVPQGYSMPKYQEIL